MVNYFKTRNESLPENMYTFDQLRYQRKAMSNFNQSQYHVSYEALPGFERSFGEPKSSEDDYVGNLARFAGVQHKPGQNVFANHPLWKK